MQRWSFVPAGIAALVAFLGSPQASAQVATPPDADARANYWLGAAGDCGLIFDYAECSGGYAPVSTIFPTQPEINYAGLFFDGANGNDILVTPQDGFMRPRKGASLVQIAFGPTSGYPDTYTQKTVVTRSTTSTTFFGTVMSEGDVVGTGTVAVRLLLGNSLVQEWNNTNTSIPHNPSGYSYATLEHSGAPFDTIEYEATGTYVLNAMDTGRIYLDGTPPVAANDAYTAVMDGTLTVTARGVLGNDTAGANATAVLDSNVSHGALTLNADGSFDYMPVLGYVGTDSFSYHAEQGAFSSDPATVSIRVVIPLSLTQLSDEPAGANCANGGVRIDAGLDDGSGQATPGDGVLQAGEIDQTRYVCNGGDGANGADGTNGTDGSNGHSSVMNVVPDDSGSCPNGGHRVDSGVDDNDNGTLEAEEVDATTVICDGANGADGPQGPAGPTGPAGSSGADGADGPNGANGQDGADGEDGATGATGPQGPAGPQGPQGEPGPAGESGGCSATGTTDGALFLGLFLALFAAGRRRRR
ncbi:MAG: Ig-like domain-containing protein [Myxococcota bacterium]